MMSKPEHIASIIKGVLEKEPDYTLHWASSSPLLHVGRFQIYLEREHYYSGREVWTVALRWHTQGEVR
jgi:hypothetical protein